MMGEPADGTLASEIKEKEVLDKNTLVEGYEVCRLAGPFVMGALKVGSIGSIVATFADPPPWISHGTALLTLKAFWISLVVFTMIQVVTFYFPKFCPSCFVRPDAAQRPNRIAISNRVERKDDGFFARHQINKYKMIVINESATILADISFILASFAYFYVALYDNCFVVGAAKQRSVSDEFLTKTQKLVLLPAFVLLITFIVAIVDAFKKSDDLWLDSSYCKCFLGCSLVRDVFRSVTTSAKFLTSTITFLLYFHGVCLSQWIDPHGCPEAQLIIDVSSRTVYTLNSTVFFPDVGRKTKSKIIEISYSTFLREHGENASFACNSDVSVASSNVRKRNCNLETFQVTVNPDRMFRIAKSRHLGTSDGLLFQWPCHVTAKVRVVRQNVSCRYRVKLLIDRNSDFIFNYDYVYQLPESAKYARVGSEWSKRSKYSDFDSVITAGSLDSFRDFGNLFSKVDKQLANVTFPAPAADLIADEPHTLHIECNRTCFCYDCVVDSIVVLPEFCHSICPSRQRHHYTDHLKSDFCKSDEPDNCVAKWIPISQIQFDSSADKSQLLSVQKSPNITVFLGEKNFTARMSSDVTLPPPGESTEATIVADSSCNTAVVIGTTTVAVTVATLVVLLASTFKTFVRDYGLLQNSLRRRRDKAAQELLLLAANANTQSLPCTVIHSAPGIPVDRDTMVEEFPGALGETKSHSAASSAHQSGSSTPNNNDAATDPATLHYTAKERFSPAANNEAETGHLLKDAAP